MPGCKHTCSSSSRPACFSASLRAEHKRVQQRIERRSASDVRQLLSCVKQARCCVDNDRERLTCHCVMRNHYAGQRSDSSAQIYRPVESENKREVGPFRSVCPTVQWIQGFAPVNIVKDQHDRLPMLPLVRPRARGECLQRLIRVVFLLGTAAAENRLKGRNEAVHVVEIGREGSARSAGSLT